MDVRDMVLSVQPRPIGPGYLGNKKDVREGGRGDGWTLNLPTAL